MTRIMPKGIDDQNREALARERIVEVELWRLSTARSGQQWRDEVVALQQNHRFASEAIRCTVGHRKVS